MDPVDEERPSAIRSSFMPNSTFAPTLNPTTEAGTEAHIGPNAAIHDYHDRQTSNAEGVRPSRMRVTWNNAKNDTEKGLKSVLSMTRSPLQVQKKTEDGTMKIGNSHTSDKIKDLLRQYDVNGDDTLDIDEVTALVEHLMTEERQGRNLKLVVIGMIIFTLVLIAAMTGLTYVVVVSLKDTKLTNNYVMVGKDSNQPIKVGSADFTVVDGLIAAYSSPLLQSDGSASVIPPTASSASTLRTAAFTGTTQPLHSGMDIEELIEMNFIRVASEGGSVALRVNGVARVSVNQSQYGSVLQIMTDAGTVTLDGNIITYDDKLAPVFKNAGFNVGSSKRRRRMLLQGENSEIDAKYNRMVDVPPIQPLLNQEYKTAWDVSAENKEDAAAISKTLQDLLAADAPDQDFSSVWANWKIANDRIFGNVDDDTAAYLQWKKSMLPIININNNALPYWASLNEYSAMSPYEFAGTRLLKTAINLTQLQETVAARPGHRRLVEAYESRRKLSADFGAVAPAVNWVSMAKVTPVKNQGACGSCWAYAAIGAIESAYLIASMQTVSGPLDNSVVDLSEEQIIQCTNSATNAYFQSMGCDGGDPLEAISYTFVEPLTTEKVMPDNSRITGKTGICDVVTVKNLQRTQQLQTEEDANYAYPFNDEMEIKLAVMKQPIAIYFMVDDTFMNYKGGIYVPTTCTTATNHNMLLVGYNSFAPIPYWIVKNQWGIGWGENGYVRIKMTGDLWGPCGMYGFVAIPSLNFQLSLGNALPLQGGVPAVGRRKAASVGPDVSTSA